MGGWKLFIGIVSIIACGIAIILGLIPIATWAISRSGLAMLWTAAVAGLMSGVLLVIQALRQRRT